MPDAASALDMEHSFSDGRTILWNGKVIFREYQGYRTELHRHGKAYPHAWQQHLVFAHGHVSARTEFAWPPTDAAQKPDRLPPRPPDSRTPAEMLRLRKVGRGALPRQKRGVRDMDAERRQRRGIRGLTSGAPPGPAERARRGAWA